MLAAREKLCPLLKPLKHRGCWCNDPKFYYSGGDSEGPQGSVNLSSVWFQQGHNVSTLANRIQISAAHYKSGNDATISTHFCQLQVSCCIEPAGRNLWIQCNFECDPGSYSSKALWISSCSYFSELFICLAVSQKWRYKTANCKLTILQQAVITVLLEIIIAVLYSFT